MKYVIGALQLTLPRALPPFNLALDPGTDSGQIQCVLQTMYWPPSCAGSASVFLNRLVKYIDSVFGFIV